MKIFDQVINKCIAFLTQLENEELKTISIFTFAGLILITFLSLGYIVFKRREYKIRIDKITKMQREVNNLIETDSKIKAKNALLNKVINDNKSKLSSVNDLINNFAKKLDIKLEDGWEKKSSSIDKKNLDNKKSNVIELTMKNINLQQIYQFVDYIRDEPYLVIRNLKIQNDKGSLSSNIKITHKRA